MGALLYDSFLVAAIWMLLGFLLQLLVGPDTNSLVNGQVETDPILDAVLFTLMLGSSLGFYLWFWCRGGQTLGMLAWQLKVTNIDGSPLTARQALTRWLLAWPAFLLFGIGYWCLYLDPERRAIHDRLSNTRVSIVQRPKS